MTQEESGGPPHHRASGQVDGIRQRREGCCEPGGIFTLAQVTELLDLAIEDHCASCTTALPKYKNEKFSDFNLMDVSALK